MLVPEFQSLDLEGLIEIRPRRFGDERGFFSEVWRDEWCKQIGFEGRFVQDNHSYSKHAGVVRGMHFQSPPAGQDKLVRCARGSIFDVALDIRKESPTYGHWAGVKLSAGEWNQLFIPKGFAHGFMTLESETEVLYKVSHVHSPEHDCAIRFDDPAVAIEWPVNVGPLTISHKDRAAPLLAEIATGF